MYQSCSHLEDRLPEISEALAFNYHFQFNRGEQRKYLYRVYVIGRYDCNCD
jgi:hypothetical protein